MEKVTFNIVTKQIEYSFSGEDIPHHYLAGRKSFSKEDAYLTCFAESVEDVIDLKIKNVFYDLAMLLTYNHIVRCQLDKNYILATGVKDSQSKKTVYHVAISRVNTGMFTLSPERYFYRLLSVLSDANGTCVIAVRRGPFDKKNVNGVLQKVSEWSYEEVILRGNLQDCIKWYSLITVKPFIIGVLMPSLCESYNDENRVSRLFEVIDTYSDKLIHERAMHILNILCEEFELEKDALEYYKDDQEIWREISMDEERSMDEETDGFWLWNID